MILCYNISDNKSKNSIYKNINSVFNIANKQGLLGKNGVKCRFFWIKEINALFLRRKSPRRTV